MFEAGIIVATVAFVMVAWNFALTRQQPANNDNDSHKSERSLSTLYPFKAISYENHDEIDYVCEDLRGYFRMIKRREHDAGVPPGTMTPLPWRSIWYGAGKQHTVMSVNIQGGQHRHTAHNAISRESSNNREEKYGDEREHTGGAAPPYGPQASPETSLMPSVEMERAVTFSDSATHDGKV